MRCLFSLQLKINSFALTLARDHMHPGCTTRTFSNICLHCLTYAHTLPASREMWHFRAECVLDDTSWRTAQAEFVALLFSTSAALRQSLRNKTHLIDWLSREIR